MQKFTDCAIFPTERNCWPAFPSDCAHWLLLYDTIHLPIPHTLLERKGHVRNVKHLTCCCSRWTRHDCLQRRYSREVGTCLPDTPLNWGCFQPHRERCGHRNTWPWSGWQHWSPSLRLVIASANDDGWYVIFTLHYMIKESHNQKYGWHCVWAPANTMIIIHH